MKVKHSPFNSRNLPAKHIKTADDICGIDGGAHKWQCSNYTEYVDRGECDCGAVRFFPNEMGEFARSQAEIYNEKHSRPGKEFKGVLPANILNKKVQNEAGAGNNTSTSLGIKEENMAAKLDIEDLTPETRQRLIDSLPPIPKKPDLTGIKKGATKNILGKYYKEHESEILTDYNLLGDSAARKRWGCSGCYWNKFKRKHGFPILNYKKRAKPAEPDKNNFDVAEKAARLPELPEVKPPPAPAGPQVGQPPSVSGPPVHQKPGAPIQKGQIQPPQPWPRPDIKPPDTTEPEKTPVKYRCLSAPFNRCKLRFNCPVIKDCDDEGSLDCVLFEKATQSAHPEQVEGEWAEDTKTIGPGVITCTLRLDTEQLEKDIAAAREKLLNLNALRLSVLPRFRWWWLPSVQKKYLDVLQEILKK